MSREPSRRAFLAMRAVKAAATTAVATTAVVLTLGGATATPGDTRSPDSASVDGELLDERCADSAGRAVVRTPRGETKAVSFHQGWQVYQGERPGTLVVVCPD